MELKIQNFPVKQVCFGTENAYRDGVLTLDKQAAIDYLMGLDEHITELDIEIANPGDDTRIVPVDNPDRIQSASATRWGRYDVSGMERLAAGEFKTIHAGFDPAAANADPNVIVPLDAMRTYEKEHRIGRLHSYFYSTVGTGTTEAEARRMTKEIIPYLQEDGVNAIVMGST